MRFIATANTDIGNTKKTNQDSLLVKHALVNNNEVLMAIICDGMGGLAKGELASATVVKEFQKWFDDHLKEEINNLDMSIIGNKWSLLLKDLNYKIMRYSKENNINAIGTTFLGILFIDDKYVINHIGDCRLYHIDNQITQVTQDQTFVAREISLGRMTLEQAKTDKRRNMLLQCVGASKCVDPDVICGDVLNGVYMLCSDGFRHEISEQEMFDYLNPTVLTCKKTMTKQSKYLINLAKSRKEKDNISVILIKVDRGDI